MSKLQTGVGIAIIVLSVIHLNLPEPVSLLWNLAYLCLWALAVAGSAAADDLADTISLTGMFRLVTRATIAISYTVVVLVTLVFLLPMLIHTRLA